jgi:hypothetical protein
MNDFLDQTALCISVRTAHPLAHLAFEEWPPLLTLAAAGFLMALVLLIPSFFEAIAWSLRTIRRRLARGAQKRHGPWSAQGGHGWLDLRRHQNHRTK